MEVEFSGKRRSDWGSPEHWRWPQRQSLARVVVVDPSYGYGYGPQNYAGPYGGSAYAPGYGSRSWDYPAGDDIAGPYSPCYPTQRAQNRC